MAELPEPGPLEGRVALVTGASRGIGLASAKALTAAGAAQAVLFVVSQPPEVNVDELRLSRA